jgi:hypothetical protein
MVEAEKFSHHPCTQCAVSNTPHHVTLIDSVFSIIPSFILYSHSVLSVIPSSINYPSRHCAVCNTQCHQLFLFKGCCLYPVSSVTLADTLLYLSSPLLSFTLIHSMLLIIPSFITAHIHIVHFLLSLLSSVTPVSLHVFVIFHFHNNLNTVCFCSCACWSGHMAV